MSTNDSKAIRKSFLRQLLEVFVTLSLGIGLVAPVIIFWTSWQQVRIYSERTADQIAAVFANDVRYSLLVGSGKDAKTVVDNIVKFPDVLHAEVFDVRDRPLAVGNAREAANARRTFAIERVVTVDATASSSALEDGQSTSADVGRVRLAVSLDRAYGSSLATAYYAAAQIAALTLLLSAALIRVSMKMLAPLAQLVRVLGSGDGGASLPSISARSPAEVHVIYEAIDSMQRRIADDNRRLIRYANGL
jgi:two-component system, sensor histidine kinase